MGMRLFYVTVFVIFFWERGRAAVGGFAVFLRGVLGKVAFFMWRFCGESMVDCGAIVERRHHVAERLKTCHEFEVYFGSGVEKQRWRFRFGNGAPRDPRGAHSLR
jgi:hypothetical protein